jgi:hypothetical protein
VRMKRRKSPWNWPSLVHHLMTNAADADGSGTVTAPVCCWEDSDPHRDGASWSQAEAEVDNSWAELWQKDGAARAAEMTVEAVDTMRMRTVAVDGWPSAVCDSQRWKTTVCCSCRAATAQGRNEVVASYVVDRQT